MTALPPRPHLGGGQPPPKRGRSFGTILAIVLALAASVGLVIEATSDDDGAGPHRGTVRIHVGETAGGAPVSERIPVDALDEAEASDVAHHDGLRSELPVGAPRGDLEAAQRQDDALARNDQLPTVSPDAAPVQRGCVSRFVRNYSTRRGVAPRLIVLHYTVSHNILHSWADVLAIVHLFDTASFQASSNYVVDGDGKCAYIVRESDKAWAQAALNPVAISIEVIAYGDEPTYLAPAGRAKLALVVHDAARRWGIPLRVGKVSGGVVVRSGVIDHLHLGAAGGGHHDVSPFGSTCRSGAGDSLRCVSAVAAQARRLDGPSKRTRRACTELNRLRRHSLAYHRRYPEAAARPRRLDAGDRRRGNVLRHRIRKAGWSCRVGPPHRAGSLTRR